MCRSVRPLLAAALLCLVSSGAFARAKRHRVPAFEPTDLDLEVPPTLELGLQFGAVFRDDEPRTRLFVPDFELDLGLSSRVELDVDGALSLDREGDSYSLAADNLWSSVKLGFWAHKDPLDQNRVWALGMQLGPRLPVADGAYGTGFGAVLLATRMDAPWHVIANLGGILEPKERGTTDRSLVLLGGVDVDFDLDRDNRWSLLAETGSGYSLGPDPNDVHATLGLDLAATDWLDFSLVGFYGFVAGGDRYGAFLGVTPKLAASAPPNVE